MEVIMRSRNLDVPAGLLSTARRKLDRLERVASDASRAEVDFAGERNPRLAGRTQCAITLHVRGGTISAHAAAPLPEAALERVLEKLRHQVCRRKDRRVSGRGRRALSARKR